MALIAGSASELRTDTSVCSLCGGGPLRPSWLNRIDYAGQEFHYRECRDCGSLHCRPMPDEELLSRMYGADYAASVAADASITDPKQPQSVVQWLRSLPPGTFLDYGCGDGRLLVDARRSGWQAIGVEYDEAVANATSLRTGAHVVSLHTWGTLPRPCADVVHLGDVIEHLTELPDQFAEILELLKPGGLLIAQGPLEANANLFTLVVRCSRSLRRSRRTTMAPYHVLLATARGQEQFFDRHDLEPLEYTVHEVAWPAPDTLSWSMCLRLRPAGLFLLRRCSQAVSRLRPDRWGNRYFYVGRKREVTVDDSGITAGTWMNAQENSSGCRCKN